MDPPHNASRSDPTPHLRPDAAISGSRAIGAASRRRHRPTASSSAMPTCGVAVFRAGSEPPFFHHFHLRLPVAGGILDYFRRQSAPYCQGRQHLYRAFGVPHFRALQWFHQSLRHECPAHQHCIFRGNRAINTDGIDIRCYQWHCAAQRGVWLSRVQLRWH